MVSSVRPGEGGVSQIAGKLPKDAPVATRSAAEALFESRTVAEIREIEARTRRDIEAKKQQIRQLVGDSYRDLIDSSDKIVGISNNCGLILQSIKDIQHGFSFLAHSFASADNLLNEKRDSVSRHEVLHAVSGRVRYLVDTPEIIWGYLDSQQYLNAAQRYLRAQIIRQQLKQNFPADLLGKFPLLSHQWPVVQKFKSQIASMVTSTLSSHANLSYERTADALAALAALNGLDGAAALKELLQARIAAFKAQLQAPQQQASDHESVAGLLAEAAGTIQATVSQVGKLFLASSHQNGSDAAKGRPGGGGGGGADVSGSVSCAMQQLVREDELDVSELVFGGSQGSGLNASDTASAPELSEWHKASKSMQDRLVALSSGAVEQAVTAWVKELATEAASHGGELLSACHDAKQLMDVASKLRAAIDSWRSPDSAKNGFGRDITNTAAYHSGNSVGGGKRPNLSVALPRSKTITRGGVETIGGASESMAQASGIWDAVCESVLGTQLKLWQEVFYPLFQTRAKQLISDAFAAVAASVLPQLDEYLNEAAQTAPQPAGQVQPTSWPQQLPAGFEPNNMQTGSASGLPATTGGFLHKDTHALPWSERLATTSMAAGSKTQAKSASNADYRLGVHAIRQHVDQLLLAVLQASLLLLGNEPTTNHLSSAGSASLSSQRSLAGAGSFSMRHASNYPGPVRDVTKISDLEPFVQLKCSEMATTLSSQLNEKLQALGKPASGTSGVAAAEQALLVGRLCSALAWDSRFLGVLLEPPEQWRAAVISTNQSGVRGQTSSMRPGAKGVTPSSKMQAVVDQLRHTAVQAFRLWAEWASDCLVTSFRNSLLTDDTLTSNGVPLSWQETVIPASSAPEAALDAASLDDAPMTDMRFSLPACPSAAMQALLCGACNELRRAGDHAAPLECMQVWEWELLGSCLNCISELTGSTSDISSTDNEPSLLSKLPTFPTSLSSQLTEKGVLQLLFDVRLVREVLAGGRPLVKAVSSAGNGRAAALLELQDPALVAAMNNRRRTGIQLEQSLQDRLDPIDWATYEHQLWAAVRSHQQRCAVLYGILTQINRGALEGTTVGSRAAGVAAGMLGAGAIQTSTKDINALAKLPDAPRFQYLPIAVPTVGGLAASKNRASVRSFNKLAAGADSSSDLAGAYSFANLGTNARASGGSTTTTATAAAAAAANTSSIGASASNAFGALQARLGTTGALGSLGTLLGDKAAEMTAMAQQRFDLGNLSELGNALGTAAGGLGTGLLSSLAKGVAKR